VNHHNSQQYQKERNQADNTEFTSQSQAGIHAYGKIDAFSLTGQNFYRGIVFNSDLPFGKDAYE